MPLKNHFERSTGPSDLAHFDLANATLDVIEKQVIIERLQRFDNNCHETAASLGLSRSSYYRRLEKHDL